MVDNAIFLSQGQPGLPGLPGAKGQKGATAVADSLPGLPGNESLAINYPSIMHAECRLM